METDIGVVSVKILRHLMRIVVIVFAVRVAAQAVTLTGTVLDPQQLVVVGAKVSLVCGKHIDTRKTDGEGNFTFIRQDFPANCKLRVVSPNFAALELPLGHRRTFIVQLQIAAQKQTVAVAADKLSHTPLDSVSLSEDELRAISSNSDDLIAYAKQVAGVYSGGDALYVDGMPADHPPPADRIAAITINADPFSAEYSDAGDAHIDITTKSAERKFQITSAGGSLGTKAPNGLNPRLGSTSNTAMLGITVPYPICLLPSRLMFNTQGTWPECRLKPTFPRCPESQLSRSSAVTSTGQNMVYRLGTDYSRNDSLCGNASFYVNTAKQTNMGAGGISLPEAGVSQNSSAQEFRRHRHRDYKTFCVPSRLLCGLGQLQSNGQFRHAGREYCSGAFIAGGAAINQQSTPWTRWTLKGMSCNPTGKIISGVLALQSCAGEMKKVLADYLTAKSTLTILRITF